MSYMEDLYPSFQNQDLFNYFDINDRNNNDYFSITERNDSFPKNLNIEQNDTILKKKILKIEDEKDFEKKTENKKNELISIDVNSDNTMKFGGNFLNQLDIKSFSFNENEENEYKKSIDSCNTKRKRKREIYINNNSDNNNEILNEKKIKIKSHPSNNLFCIIKNDNLRRRTDYIIKIIKPFMIDILTIFANTLIEKYKKDDFGNTIIISPLLKINGDQASECNVKFNKDFLQKTLKDILSAPITTKIKQYETEYNKNVINKYYTTNKVQKIKNFFDMTFQDSFIYLKNKQMPIFQGLEIIYEKQLNIKKNKNVKHKEIIEENILNFIEIINGRKPKKTISNNCKIDQMTKIQGGLGPPSEEEINI